MTGARRPRRRPGRTRGAPETTGGPERRRTEPAAGRVRPVPAAPRKDPNRRSGRCRFRHDRRGSGGAPGRIGAGQHGFVTAELAVGLPVVVAVLALSMWAVATVGVKVRATDAAHSAALAAARGEDPQAVAAAYLPDGASVSVAHDGDVVRTTVTAPSRPLGALAPEVEVSAEGWAPKEPGLPE